MLDSWSLPIVLKYHWLLPYQILSTTRACKRIMLTEPHPISSTKLLYYCHVCWFSSDQSWVRPLTNNPLGRKLWSRWIDVGQNKFTFCSTMVSFTVEDKDMSNKSLPRQSATVRGKLRCYVLCERRNELQHATRWRPSVVGHCKRGLSQLDHTDSESNWNKRPLGQSLALGLATVPQDVYFS